MRRISKAGLCVLLALALPAHATDHRLRVVNDGSIPVTSLAYSPPGSDRWFVMADGPIEAGETGQVVIAMPPSACVFDFRVKYQGAPQQLIRGWNVCRAPTLHVGVGEKAAD
ncbi:hypothetical protein P3W24_06690 [Luteibacter sp. PPL201]|uniref:Protease inhibitor I42 family protein n=1 Tax=Luteibacter sahnii TaxID=3021977 RepID=A0ABT6B9S4_9GAMM